MKMLECPNCFGEGRVYMDEEDFSNTEMKTCPWCNGEGKRMQVEVLDIHQFLPVGFDMDGYCSTGDGGMYRWEERADKALIEKGLELVGGWSDGERDSFGPLSRYRRANMDGHLVKFMYG